MREGTLVGLGSRMAESSALTMLTLPVLEAGARESAVTDRLCHV